MVREKRYLPMEIYMLGFMLMVNHQDMVNIFGVMELFIGVDSRFKFRLL